MITLISRNIFRYWKCPYSGVAVLIAACASLAVCKLKICQINWSWQPVISCKQDFPQRFFILWTVIVVNWVKKGCRLMSVHRGTYVIATSLNVITHRVLNVFTLGETVMLSAWVISWSLWMFKNRPQHVWEKKNISSLLIFYLVFRERNCCPERNSKQRKMEQPIIGNLVWEV